MRRLTIRAMLRDVGARIRGRCNRAPLYMVDGGYHFWRCGLRHGHDGPCRTGNYWWGPGGSIFDPDSPYKPSTKQDAGRENSQQREARRRWDEMSDAKRAHQAHEEARAVEAAEITAQAFKPTDEGDY